MARSILHLLPWSGVGERSFFGPDLNQEVEEKVRLIKDRLKIAQSRQKSYADNKRRDVTYEVGDRAYLRVSPLHGVKRFGIKGKLVIAGRWRQKIVGA
jgi:hypothetical protein